jgi:hypothetical protein
MSGPLFRGGKSSDAAMLTIALGADNEAAAAGIARR